VARVLGLDPGARRCGVAVSDSAGAMAFPRPALRAGEGLAGEVERIAREESVGLVVVGRPVSLAGAATAATAAADEVFSAISERLAPTRVVQFDERLTTKSAERSLRESGVRARDQRGRVDSAAAVVMLQHYLEASRGL
jgi:putative pre-16S rRNA nuclease